MPEHTPLPWAVIPVHAQSTALRTVIAGEVGYFQIVERRRRSPEIARLTVPIPELQDQTDANADLIVRAVNAHEDLVAVCEEIYPLFRDGQLYEDHDRGTEILGRLKTALTKAKGDS